MRPDPTRRLALGGAAAALVAPSAYAGEPVYDTARQTALGEGARFGWAVLDLDGDRWSFVNRTLRLPMCSTFMWLLAASVLARVDAGRERLDRLVAYAEADLEAYAPATRAALKAQGGAGARLSVEALCEAAVTLSDNTAANLLLRETGGPAALTAWLRRTGDAVTRLDRTEPELNRAPRGEVRDTTTAQAMVESLRRLLYGAVLTAGARGRLLGWMLACKTGPNRLPAGLAPGWRAAHKTGTANLGRVSPDGDGGEAGDVGVLLPPTGAPLLIAVYVAGSRRPEPEVDRFFATIARTAIADAVSLREARRHG